MDNAGVRVTRSQRKRQTSVESDVSRSSTPTLQKINPSAEIGSPGRPIRRNRLNSGTELIATPSKLASTNTPDVANSPSVRLSARRRSLSNAAADDHIMNSAKAALARRSKFNTLVEEKENTQSINLTPGRRVTRSQSTSPPQTLEVASLRKRKSMAKFNESIVEETVEEEDAETTQEIKESAVVLTSQVGKLAPITEIEAAETHEKKTDNKSPAEGSKTTVFNESIIVDDDAATKKVYPKTPKHSNGGSCLTKDMDISMTTASFSEDFGGAKTKKNELQENVEKLNDMITNNNEMEMDISLVGNKIPELLRKSSTPLFSIKLNKFNTPEKENAILSQTPSSQNKSSTNQQQNDQKEVNNMKNSASKARNDDDDNNNDDELNKSKSKSNVKKSNSLLLESFEKQMSRKSLTKTVLKYSDESDMEMEILQKTQSAKKATPSKSSNKSQSLLEDFFNNDGELSTSQNHNSSIIAQNTPKLRKNSVKTYYVDDDDDDEDVGNKSADKKQELTQKKSSLSSKENTQKKRKNSMKIYDDDDEDFVNKSVDKKQEISQKNSSLSSKENTPKKRKSSMKIYDDDEDVANKSVDKKQEIFQKNNSPSSEQNSPKLRKNSIKTYDDDDDEDFVNKSVDKKQEIFQKNNSPSSKQNNVGNVDGVDDVDTGNKGADNDMSFKTRRSNVDTIVGHSFMETFKNGTVKSKTDTRLCRTLSDLDEPRKNVSPITKSKTRLSYSGIPVTQHVVKAVMSEKEKANETEKQSEELLTEQQFNAVFKELIEDIDPPSFPPLTPNANKKPIENVVENQQEEMAAEKMLRVEKQAAEEIEKEKEEEQEEAGDKNNEQETESNKTINESVDEKCEKENTVEIPEQNKISSLPQVWGKAGDKIDHVENSNKAATPKQLNESEINTSFVSGNKRKSKSLLSINNESYSETNDDTVTEVNNYFNNALEEDDENVSKIDAIDDAKKAVTVKNVKDNEPVTSEIKKKRRSRSVRLIHSDDDDDVDVDVGNDTETQVDNYFLVEEDQEEEEEELADNEKPYPKCLFIKGSVVEVDEEYLSGDSMDSEERAELEENELLHDGESLGSEDTDIDEQDDYEYDSFIESDTEMELLDTNDKDDGDSDNLNMSSSKKNKSFNRIVAAWSDSEDDEKERKLGKEKEGLKEEKEEEEKEGLEEEKEKKEKKGLEKEEKEKELNSSTQNTQENDQTKNELMIENDDNDGGSSAGATWGSSSVSNKDIQLDDEDEDEEEDEEAAAAFSNDVSNRSSNASKILAEDKDKDDGDDADKEDIDSATEEDEEEEDETILTNSNARLSLSKADSSVVVVSKASQSFVGNTEMLDVEDSKKRKRMSVSFCAGEYLDVSSIMMQPKDKRSKLVEQNNEAAMLVGAQSEDLEKEEETALDNENNKNIPKEKVEKQQVSSNDKEKHLRIQARLDEMLEALNQAKLKAKLKAKQSDVKKPHSKKKKHAKINVHSSLDTEVLESSATNQDAEKANIKFAVHQALKASTNILFNKIDKKLKQTLLNRLRDENPQAHQLQNEMPPNTSSAKKNKTKVSKDLRENSTPSPVRNKLLTAAGEVLVLPTTPPPIHKKNKVQEIKLSTGVVRIEASSPVSKRVVKSTNVGILREDPSTPRSIGFKVRQLYNCGQDEVPELSALHKRGKKRKRAIKESTYSLPQPQWTTSGVFKVETQQKIYKARTGKKVLVTSLSPNPGNKAPNKKYVKKHLMVGGGAIDRAMLFKKQVLQRKDVPRENPLDLINRKKRQELKQR